MPVSSVKWSAVSFCRSFICGLLTMMTLTSSPPQPPLPPAPPHPDSSSAPTIPMAAQMPPRPVIRCFIVVPSLVFAGLLPAVGFAARKSYERRCSYVQYCVTNPSDVQHFTYERTQCRRRRREDRVHGAHRPPPPFSRAAGPRSLPRGPVEGRDRQGQRAQPLPGRPAP